MMSSYPHAIVVALQTFHVQICLIITSIILFPSINKGNCCKCSGNDDYFRKLFHDEFLNLTDTGNSCFIRHAEVYQNQIS